MHSRRRTGLRQFAESNLDHVDDPAPRSDVDAADPQARAGSTGTAERRPRCAIRGFTAESGSSAPQRSSSWRTAKWFASARIGTRIRQTHRRRPVSESPPRAGLGSVVGHIRPPSGQERRQHGKGMSMSAHLAADRTHLMLDQMTALAGLLACNFVARLTHPSRRSRAPECPRTRCHVSTTAVPLPVIRSAPSAGTGQRQRRGVGGRSTRWGGVVLIGPA